MLDTNCRYIPIVDHTTHQVTPIFFKMIHSKGKTFEGKITFSAGKINWSNVLQNKTCYLAAILKLCLLTGPYQRRRHWAQGTDETLEKMRSCSLLPCCWIHVTLRLHLNIAEEKAKFTGVLIFCKNFYSSAMNKLRPWAQDTQLSARDPPLALKWSSKFFSSAKSASRRIFMFSAATGSGRPYYWNWKWEAKDFEKVFRFWRQSGSQSMLSSWPIVERICSFVYMHHFMALLWWLVKSFITSEKGTIITSKNLCLFCIFLSHK